MLRAYWTGIPAHSSPSPPVLGTVLAGLSNYDPVPLPEAAIRHDFVAPVANRVARWALPPAKATVWGHRGQAWFDCRCAGQLPENLDAVVCYENAALRTFRRAKERGITTILDAASFHHTWQDRFYDHVESDAAHAAITRRKDEEVALADHVLTLSELARRSYLEAGVPPGRVTAVPLGCDLSRFHEGADPEPDAPFTFVFAGRTNTRKGVDVLLTASRALQRQGFAHQVQLAGPGETPSDWTNADHVTQHGRLPQAELAGLFRRANCLVLPSRHDSFGMVVAEAMAAGLPAIVSDHVGAKEMVRDGENGWVVPAEDTEALRERMRWCIEHPRRVAQMQEAAVGTARRYSWEAYHERIRAVIRDILA